MCGRYSLSPQESREIMSNFEYDKLYDELLALGGYYYSLYTHQYRAEATRNAFEA